LGWNYEEISEGMSKYSEYPLTKEAIRMLMRGIEKKKGGLRGFS